MLGSNVMRGFSLLVLGLPLFGCELIVQFDRTRIDASTASDGSADGSFTDASDASFDAALEDGGDLGPPDSGADAGSEIDGGPDSALPDASVPDSALPDASVPDAMLSPGDGEPSDAGG